MEQESHGPPGAGLEELDKDDGGTGAHHEERLRELGLFS